MKEGAATVARGAVMGLADVVPGVSGGTMALLLGIYDRFIDALANVDHRLVPLLAGLRRAEGRQKFAAHARETDLSFLLLLGLGMGAAVFAGAHVLGTLIESVPVAMMAFFFGLILASSRLPWQRIKQQRSRHFIGLSLGVILASLVASLPATAATPPTGFIILAGALAITAMLLPGVSGSSLLVLLGVYPVVLAAVRGPDLAIIALFAIGAAVGLVAASRAIRWLLHHHHDTTMAGLTGLMLGSLVRVWPWRTTPGFGEGDPTLPHIGWVPLALVLAGGLLSLGLERLARQPQEPAALGEPRE